MPSLILISIDPPSVCNTSIATNEPDAHCVRVEVLDPTAQDTKTVKGGSWWCRLSWRSNYGMSIRTYYARGLSTNGRGPYPFWKYKVISCGGKKG